MSNDLRTWILDGEDWLISRILMYAKQQGYSKYTSTLEEAWRLSIRELSKALTAFPIDATITEFEADETFGDDPVSDFAIVEAHKHRKRGIDLKMFLGLFKYYRQAYLDRIEEVVTDLAEKQAALYQVTRGFDRMEIAFCSEWTDIKAEDQLTELRDRNREMTNEKNRFLTVTESLASPVILFDTQKRITYLNMAAAPILGLPERPGTFYYQNGEIDLAVPSWLEAMLEDTGDNQTDWRGEYEHVAGESPAQFFAVTVRPMLDVSEKFQGTVVILHDITALRTAETTLAMRASNLERLSHTDSLTGLLNRRGIFATADRALEMARRTRRPLCVLYGDVDNLKAVNDRFGHPIGDRVLVALGKALQKSVRASDFIARIGGDEFVIVLPDSGEIDRDLIDRRLQGHLSEELGDLSNRFRVSVSVGWVAFEPERHSTFMDLLSDADDSMYLTKQKRRREHVKAHSPAPTQGTA